MRAGPIISEPQDVRPLIQQEIALAQKGLQDGRLALCRYHLEQADTLAKAVNLASETKGVYDELKKAAEEQLVQIDAKYQEGKYLEALKGYRMLVQVMGVSPTGQAAKTRLEAAEKNPAVQSVVQEATAGQLMDDVQDLVQEQRRDLAPAPAAGQTADKAAAAAPAEPLADCEIVAAMPVQEQARVLTRLRSISSAYPLSPSGKEAAAMLKRIEHHEEVFQAVKDWEAEQVIVRAYQKGEMLYRSKYYRQAIPAYQEVIDKYPDTEYAKRAAQRIEDIRAGKTSGSASVK